MIEFPLSPQYYLEAVRTESERFHDGAQQAGLDTPVASCPGWDVAKLVAHIGVLHRWVAAMVAGGITERLDHDQIEKAPDDETRLAWLERGSAELLAALEEAGTDRVVWTLMGVGQSGFWFRRMAQETMVHRFDVELAVGSIGAVDPVLAADGVDEFWTAQLGRKLPLRPIEGIGGVFTFAASDVDATWTVRLEPNLLTMLQPGSVADVTVTGPAHELLKFVWNRGSLSNSAIIGDRGLVTSWHELIQL